MRIVIDTNLLIASYFNKKSASFEILKMAKEGKVEVLWTEPIKKEAERILQNIHATKEFNDTLTKKVFREENKVAKPPRVKVIKDDPADNKFLACAQKGVAELIITNDHHLLDIKNFQGIPILTPTQALKKLNNVT